MEMKNIEALKREAGDTAFYNEATYGGCAQAVLGAIKKVTGNKISDDVFKAATGLAGGIGNSGNTCGAITGGVMAMGIFRGREYSNMEDPEKIQIDTHRMVIELINRFMEEYGGVTCKEIQTKIMGRSFNFWSEQDMEDFLKMGGHGDRCPSVCCKSAQWVVDILQKNGYLDLECSNRV